MNELESLGVINRLIGVSPSERIVEAFNTVKNSVSNDIPMEGVKDFVCPKCNTYNEAWKKRVNTINFDKVFCWHCGQSVLIEDGELK